MGEVPGAMTETQPNIDVRFFDMAADACLSQQVVARFRRLAERDRGILNCSMSIQGDPRQPGARAYATHARVVTPNGQIVASRDDRWQSEPESLAVLVEDTMDALERRLDSRRTDALRRSVA